METRKIQSVGSGTYTVSLPKEWAESQDVTTGDIVTLHTHIDGVLVVQTEEDEDDVRRQITVPVTEEDTHFLEQSLRAAYVAGTKEVVLDGTGPFTTDQRRIVDEVTQNLSGVTVVKESETEITVRTLLDTEEVSVRQSVRQLKFVALSMHRDATAALTDGTNNGNLKDRDDQADRIYAMIDRSFARGLERRDEIDALGATRPELYELWGTTRELERIADHAEAIGASVTGIKDSVEEPSLDEIQDIGEEAREIVSEAVSVIIDDTGAETIRQTLTRRNQVRTDITTLERRLVESSKDTPHLCRILHRLRRTVEHGGNIAELALQKAIRRGDMSEQDREAETEEESEQSSPASTG